MGIFGKIGGGFKWLGKNILRLIRKDETLIVAKLAASILPIPAFYQIVTLVTELDRLEMNGYGKMAKALEDVWPILDEYGVTLDEESDARFLVELAVKVMKGKARVLETN